MNITQAFDLIVAETEVMMENRYSRYSYISGDDWEDIRVLWLHGDDSKLEGFNKCA